MTKICIIGGTCYLGEQLIQTAPCDVIAPDRKTLDLNNVNSIENFDFQDTDTLIICSRSGGGERYKFTDWPASNLVKNLDANITGTILLIQKFLQHCTTGTIVFVGSIATKNRSLYNVPYWASKQIIIDIFDALRKDYKDTLFITFNPPGFPSKRHEVGINLKERTNEEIANWIWWMIKNRINHLDVHMQ